MSDGIKQLELFRTPELTQAVETGILKMLEAQERPSASELLSRLDNEVGVHGRFDVVDAILRLQTTKSLTREARRYLLNLIESGDLDLALRGPADKRREVESLVDDLLHASSIYRSSISFHGMIEFMGRFREYAPYNNMLVRIQNPSCSFYATEKDWLKRFGRHIKEDARPMLILAPMHPLLTVYPLDDTEGRPVPEELRKFGRFAGPWQSKRLDNLVENARRHKVRVDFRPLSSTYAGFAQALGASGEWKLRIAVHDGLDEPSRFGVLCHELAHVFLGHLGSDHDAWWPARDGVSRRTREIEAESVAYIVTTRFGLTGTSASYVSRYLDGEVLPSTVSIDNIGKVAGRIMRMAEKLLAPPRPKPPKRVRKARLWSGLGEPGGLWRGL